MYKESSRIEYIDLFRAIGIVLMIMGHIGFGSIFDKWIHGFHMPMFFIISGYFYKHQNIICILKKRIKNLLFPYLVFGLLHSVIYFVQMGKGDIHTLYLLFWENTAGLGIPIGGALWFLTAMFISDILFAIIQMITLNDGWKVFVSFLVATVGMICATYLPLRLPWAMDAGFVGVGMNQIGYLIKKKFDKIIQLDLFSTVVAASVFSIFCLNLNGFVNLRTGKYANWFMFWVNAIGMTISLWNFSHIINEKIKIMSLFVKAYKWFCSIGRDSIVFLCLNQLAIMIARKVISYIGLEGGLLVLFLQNISILVIVLALLTITRGVICKTWLKVILGR